MSNDEPDIRYDVIYVVCIVACMFLFGMLASKAGIPVITPSQPRDESPTDTKPIDMPLSGEIET